MQGMTGTLWQGPALPGKVNGAVKRRLLFQINLFYGKLNELCSRGFAVSLHGFLNPRTGVREVL